MLPVLFIFIFLLTYCARTSEVEGGRSKEVVNAGRKRQRKAKEKKRTYGKKNIKKVKKKKTNAGALSSRKKGRRNIFFMLFSVFMSDKSGAKLVMSIANRTPSSPDFRLGAGHPTLSMFALDIAQASATDDQAWIMLVAVV